MQELTWRVKEEAFRLGADLAGIAPVSRYEGAPEKLDPRAHLPSAQSVISLAVHHPDASVEWGGEPNPNYPGPFQIGMIPKLDTIAFRLARFLQGQGYITLPLPCTFYWRHRPYKNIPYAHASSFSHMNAFVAAGLGEYGWHGMVMSPEYGPRQRIISIITEAPLAGDPLYAGEPLCDRCMQCEKACYGANYAPDHLLEPETISFEIEDKKIEYANINRWRCFWGEQCHLDMRQLAHEKNLDETKIYEAMDRGVKRIVAGNAGYMCASFKHCMTKAARRWDKSYTPGPRREKKLLQLSTETLRNKVLELAKNVGSDRIAIQPLAKFRHLQGSFHDGFRTEEMFNTFQWVIAIGRRLPGYFVEKQPLALKNRTPAANMTHGRMMMGVMDIARYLDDSGYEAMQVWSQTGLTEAVAESVGWTDGADGWVVTESLVCNAPLGTEISGIEGVLNDVPVEALMGSAPEKFPFIDLLGSARLKDLVFDDARALLNHVPGCRSIITVGTELPRRVVELAGKQEAECGMSYQYVNYQALRESFWAAQDIAAALEQRGHFAVPLIELSVSSKGRPAPYVSVLPDLRDQAPFAAATGIGALGKSGFLITPEFGPRQRYAFVLTDADIPVCEQHSHGLPCPENCLACVEACPVSALDKLKTSLFNVTVRDKYPVFDRHATRCQWAGSLGMVEGEGVGLCGWLTPDSPVPEHLSEKEVKEALSLKDPIQIRCYGNPNHSDTLIERCLQACPLGSGAG